MTTDVQVWRPEQMLGRIDDDAPTDVWTRALVGSHQFMVDRRRLDRRGLPCPACGSGVPTCADIDPATGKNYPHDVFCAVMCAPDVCGPCAAAFGWVR